jgi:putative nucleotidyltransferase-like protein/radical SAM family protein/4Fe-4S single cluster protein
MSLGRSRPATLLPASAMALMVTRRCNMKCGHCSVESGPDIRAEPTERELLEQVRRAAAADVRSINLTGGEPMLRPATVLRLVRAARRLGVRTSLTTNGSWGRTAARARRGVRTLRRAGLGSLAVSVDRYHDEFQGPMPALLIARAAEEVGLPVRISLVVPAGGDGLAPLVAPFDGLRSTRLRFYSLQAVGRARGLPSETMGGDVEGFCSACAVPALTDDARLTACNGPAYFAPESSPLVVGSIRKETLGTLLARHREHPILETIRTFGPARLRDELKALPGFERFPFRARYLGICDLCLHITSDAAAVAALQKRLDDPGLAAERRAAWLVIQDSRQRGELNSGYVNGPGAARVFLRAAAEPEARWTEETGEILRRPDVDWKHWASYLAACGLGRSLAPALRDTELVQWAPAFFTEALRTAAVRQGIVELVQRDVLRQVESALRSIGARGVLLKGMALMLRAQEEGTPVPPRATGDLDVYVEPGRALDLRRRLLELGFIGAADARPTSTHHLAPVKHQGIAVEIHTRLVASYWGLPESEMLARARPLASLESIDTLDPEGLLLHAVVHCSQHSFSHGLRAAWDILAILRDRPAFDWPRLARWVSSMRAPRAFWVPAAVLSRELELPLPSDFLRGAPRDALQGRLEAVATYRLFRVAESVEDLDPVSRNALLFLLHDSVGARARYLASLCRWALVRPGRTNPRTEPSRPGPRGVRQAWLHFQQYRRAVARAAANED